MIGYITLDELDNIKHKIVNVRGEVHRVIKELQETEEHLQAFENHILSISISTKVHDNPYKGEEDGVAKG